MNFPWIFNSEHIVPGYYNITGSYIFKPQHINIPQENNENLDLGLYLKNNNLNNEEINKYLPFPNNLTDIVICSNKFSELPQLPDQLSCLDIRHNNFTILPNLPPNLEYLFCNNNSIERIEALPPSLLSFHCDFNKLTFIPENLLHDGLEIITIDHNNLDFLPKKLPVSLEELNCGFNKLTELPELPEKLKIFDCQNNLIPLLPDLPKELEKLDCRNNKLTVLPKLPNSLRILFCRGNDFDYDSIERIIQFYRNAIAQNFINTNPSFQEELEYFISQKNLNTRNSITTTYSLENQDVHIPNDAINKVLEYSNLRQVKRGGKSLKKKNKKYKKKNNKKTLKKRKFYI
uniref:Uncharacterized protein n=1 Tax=viral metagenome TaxID=1070528 RepID=A0A6C0KS62_9ZZZZ